jgi:cytidine deaminase
MLSNEVIQENDTEVMIKHATVARDNAYTPHSNFNVGSSILTTKGLFSGSNIENSSYSLCMCAERTTMFEAINAGCRKGDFKVVTVIANTKNPIVPCGACLQFMSEFLDRETPVNLCRQDGTYETYQFKELLPITFHIDD